MGERSIATWLAYCADPGSFGSARQVAAFAGLNPQHRESGSSIALYEIRRSRPFSSVRFSTGSA